MMTCKYRITVKPAVLLLAGLLHVCIPAKSQIVINGDIYGGGRNGAVGTAIVNDANVGINSISFSSDNKDTTTTTKITILAGTVRTVFGGGENGRTYGSTSILVQGDSTQIGGNDWNGTYHGGVFGAGDGKLAYVFGHSNVLIKGGTIVQNVYGGGNQADLMGTTTVRLQGGDLKGTVFGGARVANIFGHSFVDIDGANAADSLIISAVYGGNDIGGNIEPGNWSWTTHLSIPKEFSLATKNKIGNSCNSFVHSSLEATGKHIFVGQIFAGGNGDYNYTKFTGSNGQDSLSMGPFQVLTTPEVTTAYMELNGGTFGYVYGGGNKATVTGKVDICLNDSTDNLCAIDVDRLEAMGVSADTANFIVNNGKATPKYQFDRVFGGNNKADMSILPEWHLVKASINNLYSGGNAGNMTNENGLLLVLANDNLTINTVYGGCRMADVSPKLASGRVVAAKSDTITVNGNLLKYSFPEDHSARVFIAGGNINNVYGGNDITGNVTGGNAIDIRSKINGDVYGGGNGSYAYTDNIALKDDKIYGDFYYNPGLSSLDSLNAYRPNANQAWIHVQGTQDKPTVIGGSLYLGGNSATLNIAGQDTTKNATLRIGSYAIIQDVFLGSNGENMINDSIMALYHNGKVHTSATNEEVDFSSITWGDATFAKYMDGVAVGIRPKIMFDNGDEAYINNTTRIGSLYFGGNRGSVTAAGTFGVSIDEPVIIFDKLVAGCNNANYTNSTYSINYQGGITNNTGLDQDGTKIRVTLNGITLRPGTLNIETGVLSPKTKVLAGGNTRLDGGNIFGGCYESGVVNGNVVINVASDAIGSLFSSTDMTTLGFTWENHRDSVMVNALSVFGGGKGENAIINGNTTINVYDHGNILKVYGGGLEGQVTGNTTVNLSGLEANVNVGKIYGGGFQGPVNGHTTVNLDGGKVYDVFGGACDAQIEGYAQVIMGSGAGNTTLHRPAATKVINNVYGGNDFGGSINGHATNLGDRIREGARTMVYASEANVINASSYVEYHMGDVNYIFGGNCGAYESTDDLFLDNSFVYFNPDTVAGATTGYAANNKVVRVFGASQGYSGTSQQDSRQDKIQDRSYVLVDASDSIKNFINTDIFGAGANSGIGMRRDSSYARQNPDMVSAIVTVVRGQVKDVYGASWSEGVTRRTFVDVPAGATFTAQRIFGGAQGSTNDKPCDVIESHIRWNATQAIVTGYRSDYDADGNMKSGGVYGGNNAFRRTLYSKIEVNGTVRQNAKGYTARVFGAGYGPNTWSQYTEIHLNANSNVYEVYGGGYGGMVLNQLTFNDWGVYKHLGDNYSDTWGGLDHYLVKPTPLDDPDHPGTKLRTNTNIYINKSAYVGGYCYGAGLGASAVVSGTTYIGLHGGIVNKDLYAAGTSGPVEDWRKLALDNDNTNDFTAATYAYIEGGSARNVYGGGWEGNVGYLNPDGPDILGVSNVIVGLHEGDTLTTDKKNHDFYNGIPTIQRNLYSGGEGGAVIGTANLTINDGYIGYYYSNGNYLEKIEDDTYKDSVGVLIPNTRLADSGNAFGGGYKDNSDVYETNIKMLGGVIRNSLYGGGEIATIGRGKMKAAGEASAIRKLDTIYVAGSTHVVMYGGKVLHDVFGGGKGYDNLGRIGELGLHTDGYVFGKTEVLIYCGEVGSTETVKEGYGNVFGGGNTGFVYSGEGKQYTDGYYYKWGKVNGKNDWILDSNNKKQLTEDCRVIIAPAAKVIDNQGITLDYKQENNSETAVRATRTFNEGEFVPIEYLNCLGNKKEDAWKNYWAKIDDTTGVIIHNAVFAGGNVASGSSVYAATVTVYGNATAALHDVYHRDLISIGTDHIGGLYGDGNLTRVNGYRELNITNYGTDYYNTSHVITLDQYRNELTDRERAYFQLQYQTKQAVTVGKTKLEKDKIFNYDDWKSYGGPTSQYANKVDGTPDTTYFSVVGLCNIYAGRILNTIQRADFVGVFGSRMVLQGAMDRVPSKVDYTDYTINRVTEVSLNVQKSVVNNEKADLKEHGNYFGIYSIVNYLGAITSDVDFSNDRSVAAIRKIDDKAYNYSSEYAAKNDTTFYEWKEAHVDKRYRNNGTCLNQVALASGVYLELIKEPVEGTPELTRDSTDYWGIVTGILELDLINVMQDVGGGYVYARNIHGVRQDSVGFEEVILMPLNNNAITNKRYKYNTGDLKEYQTSGNFIHPNPAKPIIDDCYPNAGMYSGADAAPAHYWYIKGQTYIYEQYISAYTGAADAYPKEVNIPLTITAGANGKLKLVDVKSNLYAFFDGNGNKLTADSKVLVNNTTYYGLNDSISYWEYSLLNDLDKTRFVPYTYVVSADCQLGDTLFKKGDVILPNDTTIKVTDKTYKTYKGYSTLLSEAADGKVYHIAKKANVPFNEVFRPSNNMEHENGFILTYDIANPVAWDKYYTYKERQADTIVMITADQYKALTTGKQNYYNAPTYNPNKPGIRGQRMYDKGEIIPATVYNAYRTNIWPKLDTLQQKVGVQAQFDPALVLTQDVNVSNSIDEEEWWHQGLIISQSDSTEHGAKLAGKTQRALFCKEIWELSAPNMTNDFIYYGQCLSRDSIAKIGTAYYGYNNHQIDSIVNRYFTEAYYCVSDSGLFGGNYYETKYNYPALEAWASMNANDRQYFDFNYDALDLLIDPNYSQQIDLYDGGLGDTILYNTSQPIDYRAIYNGGITGKDTLKYNDKSGIQHIIKPDSILTRVQFDSIPNEQRHYSHIKADSTSHAYVVRTGFLGNNNTHYTLGNQITGSVYHDLSDYYKSLVDDITLPDTINEYYYCREPYYINEKGEGVAVRNVLDTTKTYNIGQKVPMGLIITENAYKNLTNKQKSDFLIQGRTPIGTSTLYVSAQSDILSLSRGRIITLIYEYSYDDSDESGNNVNLITERHIINIHVDFKSGTPTIAPINEPQTILPGSTMGIQSPKVTSGAYEVVGGGFEIFATNEDLQNHSNGIPFETTKTKLYWYQNGYYLTYYAKTYLGKTYSNAVQLKVANYHDLDKIMRDKEHHLYVDNPNVKRNSKIYIDNRVCYSDTTKNELDLLKDFYDLSLYTLEYDSAGKAIPIHNTLPADTTLNKHVPLQQYVKGTDKLEFILRSNIAPKSYTDWTPIGTQAECFKGNLHGDGYTISGLNNSLFGNLCDTVYNLGVTGSFSSAGIADAGGVAYNCWIKTTSSSDLSSINAVMGTGIANNCYYPNINNYSSSSQAIAKDTLAFQNGEVAYNLNSYYLEMLRSLNDANYGGTIDYKYHTIADESTGKLDSVLHNAKHLATDAIYTGTDKRKMGYVESRYFDGDFVYAVGYVPSSSDKRQHIQKVKEVNGPQDQENQQTDPDNGYYFPIWPDDYIFFGQMLTYGYDETDRPYQNTPAHINRDDQTGAMLVVEDAAHHVTYSNRVYSAPAYFGSRTNKQLVYYNAYAVLPAKTSDGKNVYPGMTAVDFTGKDDSWNNSWTGRKQVLGLDFKQLTDFQSPGQTRNLLAYVSAQKTQSVGVLNTYFGDQTFYIDTDDDDQPHFNSDGHEYSRIMPYDTTAINGHLVVMDSIYEARTNHLLVDRNDFNAPISYQFTEMAVGNKTYSTYMLYQRMPDNYVESSEGGWETVSLPFTAQLVTTDQKGEITHFYEDDNTGHEYWLRRFADVKSDTLAMFSSLAKNGSDKVVNNTFLWDTYYKKANGRDANSDTYHQNYYSDAEREYENYPMLAAATPYLIGFPGEHYYEFDLSGKFKPKNIHSSINIGNLSQQTIIFMSTENQIINVTDTVDYISSSAVVEAQSNSAFKFRPAYQALPVTNAYMMADDGMKLEYNAQATTVPFRAYMSGPVKSQGAQQRAGTRATPNVLYIGYTGDSDRLVETPAERGLNITGQSMQITIESTLDVPATVTITTTAGRLLKQFIIQPGTKVTVPVNSRGIYIVNRHKIAVTK
ncbi:MAG: hypothetical protein IK038_04635 [Bacteroidaceae bacterium]|nr:hypothetical protein [Bacteroidaceae bacterium]